MDKSLNSSLGKYVTILLLIFVSLIGGILFAYENSISELSRSKYSEGVDADPLTTRIVYSTGTVKQFWKTEDVLKTISQNKTNELTGGLQDSEETDSEVKVFKLGNVSFSALDSSNTIYDTYEEGAFPDFNDGKIWSGSIFSGSHSVVFDKEDVIEFSERKGAAYNDGYFNQDEYLAFLEKMVEPYESADIVVFSKNEKGYPDSILLYRVVTYSNLLDSEHFKKAFNLLEPFLMKISKSSDSMDQLLLVSNLRNLYGYASLRLTFGDFSKQDSLEIMKMMEASDYDWINSYKKFIVDFYVSEDSLKSVQKKSVSSIKKKGYHVSLIEKQTFILIGAENYLSVVFGTYPTSDVIEKTKLFANAYAAENLDRDLLEYYKMNNATDSWLYSSNYYLRFSDFEKLRTDLLKALKN